MSKSQNGSKARLAAQVCKEAGQLVLVFQGGGALGAFQAGVYQAVHEFGLEPDWVIGTSIGAVNASLIAGNAPENRLEALTSFWDQVTHHKPWHWFPTYRPFEQSLSYLSIMTGGLDRFFQPNSLAFANPRLRLGAEKAGYYSTGPLEKTLSEAIDFGQLNANAPRVSFGAANVSTSEMRYFDSRDETLDVRHIMASGALPPAFPAVRVDEELYWDGGILSNTPTEIVFDDYPRRDSLIFAVQLWNPKGKEPQSIWDVLNRQKDIQFSSRVTEHIKRYQVNHRLRHIIQELADLVPEEHQNTPDFDEMVSWGCLTRMHVVGLLAPAIAHEDQTKDVDFSASGIRKRWKAGYEQTKHAIETAPWRGDFDHLEGVIWHEQPFGEGQVSAA